MTTDADTRALLDQLAAAVEATWPRGWQPIDIVRIGCELGGRQAEAPIVDALTRALGRYAAVTVAPVWRQQMRSLQADPWAPHQRIREHDGQQLAAALRGVHLMTRIPSEPLLCPPPGEYVDDRHVGAERRLRDEHHGPALLAKVRALLAKAESTTFPAEAEAFTAKAQEMMARHAIDDAMLRSDDDRPARSLPGAVRVWIDAPYVRPKFRVLSAVARANGASTVLSGAGFATVVGDGNGLEATEMLFTSLLVQATAAMEAVGRGAGTRSHVRSKRFRSSFFNGFASRIGQRLMEAQATAQAAAEADTGADLLPVLRSRDEEAERRLHELFPKLSTMRVRAVDGAGWVAGASAADQCSLGVPRTPVTGGS